LPVTVSGYGEETDVVCTVIAVVNFGESQQESAAITTGSASELIIVFLIYLVCTALICESLYIKIHKVLYQKVLIVSSSL